MKLGACQKYKPEDVPTDWEVEPIKRRIWLEYGSGLTEESRAKGEFPVFGSNGQVGTHDAFTVEGPGILVGRKGSVGEVHFSETNFWPIDTVYYIRRTKNDDWRYLYYLLGYLNLGLLNAATGVPGLTRRDAHDILGAFPALDEQRRIAAAMKLADDAITKAKVELEATRELKRSLMQTLFVSGMPGRHSEFVETKIGRVPKGWQVKHVKDILVDKPINGYSPQSNPEPPGTKTLNVACIRHGECDITKATYVDIDNSVIETLQVMQGDFFVLRGNGNRDYIGIGGIVRDDIQEPMIYSDLLFRLRFKDSELVPLYIPYMWQSLTFLHRLQAKAKSGSGLWKIGKRDIEKELLALPGKDEQQEIVDVIESVTDSYVAVEQKIDALHQVKKSRRIQVTSAPRRASAKTS